LELSITLFRKIKPAHIDTLIALALALLIYFIAAAFGRIHIDPHHDGILLKPALDVLNGHMLFRDSFTQYGAFLTYMQAGAMAIFGAELLTIKLQTAFMYAVSTFFLYKCWRYFLPRGLTIISALLFIGMASFYADILLTWSSVYAMALMTITIFLLFKFIENNNYINIFFAGFLSALAFYTRQPVGIVLFISILFLLVSFCLFTSNEKKNIKRLICYFVLGYILVILVFSLFFIITGSFYDWYVQSLRFAFDFGFRGAAREVGVDGRMGDLLIHLFFSGHIWSVSANSLIWTAMPVMCIYLFFRFYVGKLHVDNKKLKVKKHASQKEIMLLFFVVISIASWHQYFPTPCVRHVHWATGIMIGIFVYSIWEALSDIIAIRRFALLILVLLMFFYGDIHHRVISGTIKQRQNLVEINFGHHLNGMMVSADFYHFFHEYFNHINSLQTMHPGIPFLNYTRDGLYGITFNENITNMTVNWGNVVYYDYHNNVLSLIDSYRPVIVSDRPVNFPGYELRTNFHHIRIYVHPETLERYRIRDLGGNRQ